MPTTDTSEKGLEEVIVSALIGCTNMPTASVSEVVAEETQPSRMPLGYAVLLKLMEQYLAAWMDPTVSLLEIHKLMYFMQEAGKGLKLSYEKGPYGPYSKTLRYALNAIEGHYLIGYGDGADDPTTPLEPSWEAMSLAAQTVQEVTETSTHLTRVADLICGFETPFGMELLATVHWVAMQEGAANAEEAMAKVHAWNNRKRMFDEKRIRLAWKILVQKGWIIEGDSTPTTN